MIVVSDTSPINYLILIDQIEVLSKLYGRVIVPPAVVNELSAAKGPDKVRQWVANHPDWLRVQPVGPVDASLSRLGAGEGEAITLAVSIEAELVLIDEIKGRQAAIGRGLNVVGTLGVLALAAERGLIGFTNAIERLQQTTFRLSPHLLKALLERPDHSG